MIEKHHHLSLGKFWLPMGLIFFCSLALGVSFQLILNVGEFGKGLSAATFLFFCVGVGLFVVWRTSRAEKIVGWMMVIAFFIRISLGIFLMWGLPQFGYDTPVQQAGFVYADPFQRETNAWALAQSGEPLRLAFSESFEGDQYGGMFALSAFIYRYLSPDAFRPVLMVILTAGASALSLPFFIAFTKRLFERKIAALGGWILALYPEGILLGASQMREPFLILLFSMLLWAGMQLINRAKPRLPISIFILSTIILFLFSPRVGIPVISVVVLLVWVIKSPEVTQSWLKTVIWIIIVFSLLLSIWFIFDWIHDAFQWDAYVTLLKSGMVQTQLDKLPGWLSLPLIILYGVFQPVLPAAIVAPAPWIWQSLGIFRSAGWYILLPLLVYAVLCFWKVEPLKKRRIIFLLVVVVWAWVLIASARAGGDQWDNPRYRTIFLPLIATLCAWGLVYAKQTKARWLWWIVLFEVHFLTYFTFWYLRRYYSIDKWIKFSSAVKIGLVIIICGCIVDYIQLRRGRKTLSKEE